MKEGLAHLTLAELQYACVYISLLGQVTYLILQTQFTWENQMHSLSKVYLEKHI